jgi:hypothetical protein
MYRYAKLGRPLLGPWLKACDDVVAFFTTACFWVDFKLYNYNLEISMYKNTSTKVLTCLRISSLTFVCYTTLGLKRLLIQTRFLEKYFHVLKQAAWWEDCIEGFG